MAAAHIFVSPHLDDVVLSCGGLVARAAATATTTVEVITVCAGQPREALTPLARQLHAAWGLDTEPVAARRDEDRRALALLAAQPRWFEELDAVYRHPAYCTGPALFGPPHPDDDLAARLARRLEAVVAAQPEAHYYFPLGVGDHVDHRVTHQVGAKLAARGVDVAFYEELPYALTPGALGHRLELLGERLLPRLVDVAEVFALKLRAGLEYRSQIASLFRDAAGLELLLSAYAAGLAGGCHERLWTGRNFG
ncbi:MAG: PIG-L family deacetylase [Deltaproteobacteria bacterium]|nr:PIG-L family deacetylase [Deltaproteobacteria bacterium]